MHLSHILIVYFQSGIPITTSTFYANITADDITKWDTTFEIFI